MEPSEAPAHSAAAQPGRAVERVPRAAAQREQWAGPAQPVVVLPGSVVLACWVAWWEVAEPQAHVAAAHQAV